jgi:hypothetical protein
MAADSEDDDDLTAASPQVLCLFGRSRAADANGWP